MFVFVRGLLFEENERKTQAMGDEEKDSLAVTRDRVSREKKRRKEEEEAR